MTTTIDHHAMAVMMSEICLTNATVHEELRTVCGEIITAQTQEISTMQSWLQDWYGISYSPQMAQGMQNQMDMSAKCKAMMPSHEKMMAEMKAADQRLDGLVVKMNAASGQAKVDATAAVVTEIAAQRKTMREGMMNVHVGMMGHMMEHMQAGPQSMAMCPMMKIGGMKH